MLTVPKGAGTQLESRLLPVKLATLPFLGIGMLPIVEESGTQLQGRWLPLKLASFAFSPDSHVPCCQRVWHPAINSAAVFTACNLYLNQYSNVAY